SITATNDEAVDIIPSTQADERPLRPKRCKHLTRESFLAISRTKDAVPSDELSATKIISQEIFGSASATAEITVGMLSRSLKVGTIIESSAERTVRTHYL